MLLFRYVALSICRSFVCLCVNVLVYPNKPTLVDLGNSSRVGAVLLGTVDPPSNVQLKMTLLQIDLKPTLRWLLRKETYMICKLNWLRPTGVPPAWLSDSIDYLQGYFTPEILNGIHILRMGGQGQRQGRKLGVEFGGRTKLSLTKFSNNPPEMFLRGTAPRPPKSPPMVSVLILFWHFHLIASLARWYCSLSVIFQTEHRYWNIEIKLGW